MNKKNIISLLVLVLTMVGISGGVYLVQRQQELSIRAAPATMIYFQPSVGTAEVGKTVSFDILVDTGENYLAAVRLEINHDATLLRALSLNFNSSLLPQPLRAVDLSQPGKITGSAGVPPGSPIHGASQKVASVSFQALTAMPQGTSLDFGTDTSAYSGTQDEPAGSNLISQKISGTVIIESGGGAPSPTPSPRPSPSPSLTPTPSPSPSPDEGGLGDGDDYGGDYGLGGSPSPSPAEIPVTGILMPTTFLLTIGGALLLLSLWLFLL